MHCQSALASRHARLLLELVESPDLEHRLGRHVFSDGDEQRRALYLLHMRDCASVVGLEGAHDPEGLRHNANSAICAAQEDALRPRDNACDAANLGEE